MSEGDPLEKKLKKLEETEVEKDKNNQLDNNSNSLDNIDRNNSNPNFIENFKSKYFSDVNIVESYQYRNKQNENSINQDTKLSQPNTKNTFKDFLANKVKLDKEILFENYTKDIASKKIHDHQIKFPVKPYPQQLGVIREMLISMLTGTSALIESPTGTGKTLSILSAIDSFLRIENMERTFKNKKKVKIYVLSRTHVQLSQLLRACNNNFNMSTSILASRETLCVNKNIRSQPEKEHLCREAIKLNKCTYFLNKDKLTKNLISGNIRKEKNKLYNYNLIENKNKNNINHAVKLDGSNTNKFIPPRKLNSDELEELNIPTFDIEDAINLSKTCKGCPYYSTRDISELASVIFAPFNYILDPYIRNTMSINIKNSIIIVDEAHNIENILRDSGSIELSVKTLEMFIIEALGFMKQGHAENLKEVYKFSVRFKRMFKILNEIDVKKTNEDNLEALKENNINNLSLDDLHDVKNLLIGEVLSNYKIRKFITCFGIDKPLLEASNSNCSSAKQNLEMKLIPVMEKFVKTLLSCYITPEIFSAKIISEEVAENVSYFGKYQTNYIKKNTRRKYTKLKLILLDPFYNFKTLKETAKSVILLSGTLSPFSLIKSELNTNFNTLCVPHVLKKNNLRIFNITKTLKLKNKQSNVYELKGTYNNLYQPWYITEITKIVIKTKNTLFKNKIVGGILVFLPSYKFINIFKDKNIPCSFFEDKKRFNEVFDEYKRNIRKNPILFCVYRGKASEGTDFKDELCRALISVGIPYPNIKETEIIEKKDFNDKYNKRYKNKLNNESLSNSLTHDYFNKRNISDGASWYSGEAMRAVNQAIGRIIRHENDWGCVLLIDSRYFYMKYQLSEWIQNKMQKVEGFDEIESDFNAFFKGRN